MEEQILNKSQKRAIRRKKQKADLDISDPNLSVAIYIRVSTKSQLEGYSLQFQEKACRDYALSRGWREENIVIYREEGASAKDDKRPVFQKMISDAEKGEFSVLIVHKLDRFMRDMRLCSEYIGKLLNDYQVALIFFGDNLEFVRDNRSDIFYAMFAWFADYYIKNLSREVTKARRAQAEKGLHRHRPPWGYYIENGNMLVDESKREAIRLAFELYSTGDYSFKNIIETLKTKGLVLFNGGAYIKTSLIRMLTNRVYSGYILYGDEYFKGQHEAIVSEELFWKCQEVDRERSEKFGIKIKNTHIAIENRVNLRQILFCNRCGNSLKIKTSHNQRGDYFDYYTDGGRQSDPPCVSSEKRINSKIPDGQIEDLLSRIALPDLWITQIIAKATPSDEALNAKKEIAKLRKKFNRLDTEYLENDNLSDEARKKNLETRKTLAQEIQRLESNLSRQTMSMDQQHVIFTSLCDHYSSATMIEKTEIAHLLFKAVYFDYEKSEIVSFEPNSDFRFLFDEIATENGWNVSSEGKFLIE